MSEAVRQQSDLLHTEMAAATDTIASNTSRLRHVEAELGSMFAANDLAGKEIDQAFDHYVELVSWVEEIKNARIQE